MRGGDSDNLTGTEVAEVHESNGAPAGVRPEAPVETETETETETVKKAPPTGPRRSFGQPLPGQASLRPTSPCQLPSLTRPTS